MAKDAPGFLQNVGDDDESKDVMSVLTEEPAAEIKSDNLDDKEHTSSPDIKPDAKEPEQKPEGDNQQKPVETPVTEPKKEDAKPDEKKPAVSDIPVKAAEKAQQQVQNANPTPQSPTPPAQQPPVQPQGQQPPAQPDRKTILETNIRALHNTPVVKFDAPDPADYNLPNGNFDIQRYFNDAATQLVLGMQRAVLTGPLAATMFGVLHDSLVEETNAQKSAQENIEYATNTYNSLKEKYPILAGSDDNAKRIQEMFEDMIYGVKAKLAREAEKSGKEPPRLTVEDYDKIMQRILAGQPAPAAPTQEPAERPTGSPQLVPSQAPVNQIDRDIEDMMNVKTKQLF